MLLAVGLASGSTLNGLDPEPARLVGYARDADWQVAAAREWRVRAWALEPDSGALAAALQSNSWEDRFDGLDALSRGYPGTRWCRVGDRAERVLALVVDPHPNVRTRAIEVVASAGLMERALSEHAPILFRESFPDARLALAQAWLSVEFPLIDDTGSLGAGIWSTLREWEQSSDPALAEASFRALAGSEFADPAAILAWLLDADGERARSRWISALDSLEQALPDRARLQAWRTALEGNVALPGAAAAFELSALRRNDERGLARLETDLPELLREPEWRAALVAAARAHPPKLGGLLWRQLEALDSGRRSAAEERAFLVECAAEASDPWLALGHARNLDIEAAGIVWETVARRIESWDADAGAYWLAEERDTGFRTLATRTMGRVVRHAPSGPAVDGLLRAAADGDERVRSSAFRALCDLPGATSRDGRLRGVWASASPDDQLELLQWLPRVEAPVAFRADLLRLGQNAATRSTSVVELLGLFPGDEPVEDALQGWLEEVLDRLDATELQSTELRALERMARSLLQAFGQVAGDGALEVTTATLDRAVRWMSLQTAERFELAVAAAFALGRDPRGRVALAGYLSEGPQSVRLEAALAWVAAGSQGEESASTQKAQAYLDARYDGLSSEQRTRAVKACAEGRGVGALAMLERVALGTGEEWGQMFAALDGLARHGQFARLQALFRAATQVEVRSACLAAIASMPGEPAHSFLADLVAQAADEGLVAQPADLAEEAAALLLDEALLFLAQRRELGERERSLWLSRPRASAAADLGARFAGRSLARADFRWRADLRLAEDFLETEQLGSVLRGATGWQRVDAELIFALAERARAGRDPALAADLFAAALVASLGEPKEPESRRRAFDCQLQLIGVCEELGRFAEVAHWCRSLRGADRSGRAPEALLDGAWGALDVAARKDPRARLASAVYQARALAAGELGDPQAAGTWAARARATLGCSEWARAAQRRVEAVLSGARPR